MPIRCVDEAGESIIAQDCSDKEWQSLRRRKPASRNLTMPCCVSPAIPKVSKLGTRFFAHKAKATCEWKPETENHLQLKAIVVEAARSAGWEAAPEVAGQTPDGERWTTDILLSKGDEQIAVEIQWSSQTNEETLRRQERYRRAGVKGVWLLRQPGFPIRPDLPAACIGGSLEKGFTVLIPNNEGMTAKDRKDLRRWPQGTLPRMFIRALCQGRFRFGIFGGETAELEILTSTHECYRCKTNHRVVSGCRTKLHGREIRIIPPQFEDLNLLSAIERNVREAGGIQPFSTQGHPIAPWAEVAINCKQCGAFNGGRYLPWAEDNTDDYEESEIRFTHAVAQDAPTRQHWWVWATEEEETA